MTNRVLKYRLPRRRLRQLLRSIYRDLLRKLLLAALGIAALVGTLVATSVYSAELEAYSPEMTKFLYAFALLSFIFVLGVVFKPSDNPASTRPPSDEEVRLTSENGGLRFETDGAEYFVKWRGITGLWLEPDGVVVAHYQAYFFVPDDAFASREEKLSLIQVIYDNISEKARSVARA
jgi:hypothetical protein